MHGGTRGFMKVPDAPDADALAKEISSLEVIKTSLMERGRLAMDKKLGDALDSYLAYLNEKKATIVSAPDNPEKPKKNDQEVDEYDYKGTYNVILAAVQRSPGNRRLVHLADVQRFVLTT